MERMAQDTEIAKSTPHVGQLSRPSVLEKLKNPVSASQKQRKNLMNWRSDDEGKPQKLYTHPAAYAREHGELEEYRASFKANVACKEAIEAAIHAHYSDNRLNTDAVFKQVVDAFGADRVEYVLAATVREKNWDGRISRENKAWAQTVPVMQNPDAWGTDRNCDFVVDQAHTGLVDLLVTHVRKILRRTFPSLQRKPLFLKSSKAHRENEASC